MRRIYAMIAAVIALGTVMLPGGFGDAAHRPDLTLAAEPDSRVLAHAAKFRSSFGFESDAEFVAATYVRDDYSADFFGVPLSIAFGTHSTSEDGPGADNGWYSPVEWGIEAYDDLSASYTYRVCKSTSCP